MRSSYRNRIKRALKLLKDGTTREALVVSSNPLVTRSRDTAYTFRQNSDLFYFTGAYNQDTTLILNPHSNQPVTLVTSPPDAVKRLWEGAQPRIAVAADAIGAEVIATNDQLRSVLKAVRGVDTLYLQSTAGSVSAALKNDLSQRSATALRGLPTSLIEAEVFTAHLRLFKDPDEVALISRAAELTSAALFSVLPLVRSGTPEREIAAFIDYFYRAHGAEPAFSTIVAAGRSAATLHYHALSRKLAKNELLLIDTGAELDMYAADVTRMIPVGDTISEPLRELYEVVLSAQSAAIKKVKPGVLFSEVYRAAALELAAGLKDLKVLRVSPSKAVASGALKEWFPHGIGHWLGIDVHDVGPASSDAHARLRPGMVITIEPGLYFGKAVRAIPACGIRIEDDLLVTAKGHRVLTERALPKELNQLFGVVSSAMVL